MLLTLRLQFIDDGRGGDEHHRGDAADPHLGHLAHRPEVRVGALGVGVDGGHQVVGGAHQGEAAHPLHHTLGENTQIK